MESWFLKVLQEAIIEREEIDQYNTQNNLSADSSPKVVAQFVDFYDSLKSYFVNDPDLLNLYLDKKKQFANSTVAFTLSLWLGLVSSLAMTVAMTFLLVETVSKLYLTCFFSPYVVLGLAMLAGTAYGLQIYNALTDMAIGGTLQSWFYGDAEIASCFDGVNLRKNRGTLAIIGRLCCLSMDMIDWWNIAYGLLTLFLIALNLFLTYFNAGTWWAVMTENRSMFVIMTKLPSFVVTILVPVILAVTQLLFNFQNTTETINKFQQGLKDFIKDYKLKYAVDKDHTFWEFFTKLIKSDKLPDSTIAADKNYWKHFDDFIAAVFFILHLVSVGVTSDRAPYFSQIFMTAVGSFSEALEDWHYFFRFDTNNKDQHAAHTHDNNLPAMIRENIKHGFNYSVNLAAYALQNLYGCLGQKVEKPMPYFKFFQDPKLYPISEAWQEQAKKYQQQPAT